MRRQRRWWTIRELTILKQIAQTASYDKHTIIAVQEKLPDRSWEAVRMKIKKMRWAK